MLAHQKEPVFAHATLQSLPSPQAACDHLWEVLTIIPASTQALGSVLWTFIDWGSPSCSVSHSPFLVTSGALGTAWLQWSGLSFCVEKWEA